MKKKQRFYTIFPRSENVHLTKDVGMIPYIFYKFFEKDSILVTYKNCEEYNYLQNEVKGLKIEFLEKRTSGRNLDLLIFILKNFRRIDILQMYHLEVDQLDVLGVYIILRKLFFKKSYTWIKCDGSSRFTLTNMEDIRFKFIRKWILNSIDLYSVETSKDYEIIRSIDFYKNINLRLIPNGFFDYNNRSKLLPSKEKIILTVGRLGTFQKNTEFLLEAFRELAKNDKEWKLILIGSLEEDFKNEFLANFTKENSDIMERIFFTGPISDRVVLKQYYERAAVFILTSRDEGSPLVIPEAISMGCYCLFSDMINLKGDIKYSSFFSLENHSELVTKIHMLNNTDFDSLKYKIQDIAYSDFYWPRVLKSIDDEIKR